MTINLHMPDIRELKPRITVFGVGGAGGNAVNNMISAGLNGVDFVVANTDAQALTSAKAERIIQMGVRATEGLGAGSHPEVGRAAAEEVLDEIRDHLSGAHMVFVTAGMGGGTGTGAAPVIARAAREAGILTVGVVTKPFHFEGARRMRTADSGIGELQKAVDTLIVIPNQNLFRVANEKTTFADAFAMADQVLYSGVACITDLMVKEGLINLDFADVRAVMREMGKAMMGTGEASGEKRAMRAAEAAIANPLLDETSMKGAKGLLISITGGRDLTLYEVDEAATRIREEVDQEANIILGATFDEGLEGIIRVSVVATGIDAAAREQTRAFTVSTSQSEPVARPAPQPARPEPAVRQAAAPVIDFSTLTIPAAEPAPVTVRDEVTIRPLAPKPQIADLPMEVAARPMPREEAPAPAAFIPPQPERAPTPARPQPRMPRIEDLPMPAQAQLRQKSGDMPTPPSADAKRMSLLQRLSSIGLGRKGDDVPAAPPVPARVAPSVVQPQARIEPAPVAPRPEGPAADYMKRPAPRPAPQGLDTHGRPAPAARPVTDDDQLDIPAFLRRQSS
jgi:cell division protein FtsZ